MAFFLADLETTGLDDQGCRIIEVAARILQPGKEIARFHSLVYPGPNTSWEPVALDMHRKSGLHAEVMDTGRMIDVVDDELRKLMDIYVPEDEPLYLMGNSVHFDRSFLARHMPRVFERLHYRQLDVTSVRLWFQLMSGEDPHIELPKPHRAEEDIENSLRQALAMWNRR